MEIFIHVGVMLCCYRKKMCCLYNCVLISKISAPWKYICDTDVMMLILKKHWYHENYPDVNIFINFFVKFYSSENNHVYSMLWYYN